MTCGLHNLHALTGPRRKLVEYMNEAIDRWLRGDPIWYLWGGQSWGKHHSEQHHPRYLNLDDSVNQYGVDCSGFVILGLIHAGILPENFDTTSSLLHGHFPDISKDEALPGDLVFFGRSRTVHVGMLYQRDRSSWIMVEAGGGRKSCKSIEIAQAKHAFVCPARITNRTDLRGFGRVCDE